MAEKLKSFFKTCWYCGRMYSISRYVCPYCGKPEVPPRDTT